MLYGEKKLKMKINLSIEAIGNWKDLRKNLVG